MQSAKRPVPSKRALRVLRQLAYISSGTACGAAAVIAEEQRRRVCLAKKIADNARQLKQHPRYAHATAAPLLHDEKALTPYIENADAFELSTQSSRSQRNYGREGTGISDDAQLDAPRSEILPSQVERSYKRLLAENIPKSYKEPESRNARGQDTDMQSPEQSGYAPSEALTSSPLPSFARPSTPLGRFDSGMKREAPTQHASEERDDIHRNLRIFMRGARGGFASGAPYLTESLRRFWQLSVLKEARPDNFAECFNNPSEGTINSLLRKCLKDQGLELMSSQEELARVATASPDGLKVAVNLFVKLYANASRSGVVPRVLAKNLLKRACEAGLLPEMESLSLWLMEENCLTEEQLFMLCKGPTLLLMKEPIDRVLKFYDSLLLAEIVQSLNQDVLNDCRAAVMAACIDVVPEHRDVGAILDLATITTRQLQDMCFRLLSDKARHRVSTVNKIFQQCMQDREHDDYSLQAAHRIFDVAKAARSMDAAVSSFNWMDSRQIADQRSYTRLLRFLVKAQRIDLISRFSTARYQERYNIPGEVSKSIWTLVETLGSEATATILGQAMSQDERDAILRICRPGWADLLRSEWKRTRNFNHVHEVFCQMQNIEGHARLPIRAYNAMIGICVTTGRVDMAREVYVDLKGKYDDLDDQPFAPFVLQAAREENWEMVNDMLNVLGKVDTPGVTREARSRLFNSVLSQYASQHPQPSKIWDFVKSTIDARLCTPDQATLNLTLSAFARGEELEMIPECMSYMKTRGYQFRFTADTISLIIRGYYKSCRPNHRVLQWMYNRLGLTSWSLMSGQLRILMKDAIAYDLKTANKAHTEPKERALAVLESLRSYETEKKVKKPEKSAHDDLKMRNNEAELLLKLAQGQAEEAVQFYQMYLSTRGVPHSQFSLEIATQASLRANNGNPTEANRLISEAVSSGTHVDSASLPMLMNRIQAMTMQDEKVPLRLFRQTVNTFYEAMNKLQKPARHHLAVSAAATLINTRRPREGIDLLQGVYHSEWATNHPFDIVGMTVFLKGYLKLGYVDGIRWVISTVLDRNMRIDAAWIETLKGALKEMQKRRQAEEYSRIDDLAEEVVQWEQLSRDRRKFQIKKTQQSAKQLVDVINNYAEVSWREAGVTGRPEEAKGDGLSDHIYDGV
ncbi:hypothetical protein M8818_005659 [Zalaria obscura]|uniref:Uncharacterized protein n=1 Tax=Zalaria obscura TaxID=2024903 RepID=A0ACC3S8N0_9PEZI